MLGRGIAAAHSAMDAATVKVKSLNDQCTALRDELSKTAVEAPVDGRFTPSNPGTLKPGTTVAPKQALGIIGK